jgi:hypothetical protein
MIFDKKTATYVLAVVTAHESGSIPTGALTTVCPECGETSNEFDSFHTVMSVNPGPELTSSGVYIIIGCEGYWVVNPNLVGIVSKTWTDWNE